MMEAANRRVARHRPALELRGGELLRHVLELGLRHLAASDEPAAGLGQRDPHEPAAALARASCESYHGAERHQVTGQIVDRRDRIELRARRGTGEQLALTVRDA